MIIDRLRSHSYWRRLGRNLLLSLAPERKQQVQGAAAAFGTQLKDTLKQTVSGLTKTDAKTQAKNAAASLESAVKQSLEPIEC